jgi:hypothetical protein
VGGCLSRKKISKISEEKLNRNVIKGPRKSQIRGGGGVVNSKEKLNIQQKLT